MRKGIFNTARSRGTKGIKANRPTKRLTHVRELEEGCYYKRELKDIHGTDLIQWFKVEELVGVEVRVRFDCESTTWWREEERKTMAPARKISKLEGLLKVGR